jgi:hypothetical protein
VARLVERRAITKELVLKLLAWRHPGSSTHVGDRIATENKRRLEDTAACLVRNPLSPKKLVYLDRQQAVLYRSRMNPFLGRNFEAINPLEWLARMSDHSPTPASTALCSTASTQTASAGAGRPRPKRAACRRSRPQALLAGLGTPDRKGLSRRSARLHPLRPAHAPRRLR